ncbi:MAG: aminotransferase class III-fold pyridoxal phosphate-dependent enzyme [Eudoraea sp.]|nr:aminotransferase class III-fold pyridoxal phosphate-dependent enzyme [Eudoraea sp.]
MQIDVVIDNYYALTNSVLTKLEGYESINYKVVCDEGVFVIKKYEYSEESLSILEAENRILSALKVLDGYEVPFPVPAKNNELLVLKEGSIFRLLSYVEGHLLGDVPQNESLLYSFGVFLATMDMFLMDLNEATIKAKENPWDLKHFNSNWSLLKYIPNPRDRNLVDYFFLQYHQYITPIAYELRQAIIHNDANDWNVLTKNGKVTGIIDFGDMCHTWLVNEVAIAMAYIMMNKEDPLVFGAEVIKGFTSVIPLEEKECDALYYLIAARLCTSVVNSAHVTSTRPSSSYITVSEKGAWDLLYKWVSISPVKAKDVFRKASGLPLSEKSKASDLMENRRRHFGKNLSLSYSTPIHMTRSAFQYMYDADGNTFLDAYNNIMLVGHSHPHVVRAAQNAMATLNTNTRYLYDELQAYTTSLLSKFPKHLNKIFFVNSGSAASDLAIRLAHIHTQKKKICVLEHGYHGNSGTGITISAYKYNAQDGIGKPAHIIETPLPKTFGTDLPDDGTAGSAFATATLQQINANSGEIAAFIAEPIVGCGGQVPLAKGYLNTIYPKIREQGGVCISDEVQVGFGRLGDVFWGYELYDVIPDIIVLGKPMGNGHPIGAVITTEDIAASFEKGPEFFSSFGGNPVSCAIGKAVLEVIEEEGLQEHAKNTGNYLIKLLEELKLSFEVIGDVRGYGLFLGVELVDLQGGPNTILAGKLKNNLRNKHILVSTDGPHDNVIKIKPPLTFTRADCDHLVSCIKTILAEISAIS